MTSFLRRWAGRAAVLGLLAAALAAPAWPQGAPALSSGVASGDVTDTRAVIWTRTTGPAAVRVEYGTSPSLGTFDTFSAGQTAPGSDFTIKADLANLRPNTRYYYRVIAAQGDQRASSMIGSFRTAPPAGETVDLTFAWGADTGEQFKPFRIFDVIRAKEPDFFLFLGDTVYADIDCNAKTLDEYRTCHRRNREDEALQRFARATSMYAVWDDHEVANNFDRTHERIPLGRQAFLEYWPVRPDPSDPTRLYRSFRWGRLVEVFVLDDRQYRSPEFERDTAQKTMLGSAQKEWLKRGLAASDAVFKVIATSVPLKYHGPDSWEGYTTERQELFDFITRNNIRRVVFLSGDVHYAAVLRYKEGFVEAISGPMAHIISRRRSVVGEPETEFAYNSSFTFGLVRVTGSPPQLVIEIYDVEGKLLHRAVVQP